MRALVAPLALLALTLAAAAPAAAQRMPVAALQTTYQPVPSDTGDTAPAVTARALRSPSKESRRALSALGGGLIGAAIGGGVGLLLISDDRRPSDQREMDGLAVVALAAVGETIGVTLGAAVPGGRAAGACRGDVRLVRSLLGSAAGTGAVALFASRAPVGYVLLPVGQVVGAVLALGGC